MNKDFGLYFNKDKSLQYATNTPSDDLDWCKEVLGDDAVEDFISYPDPDGGPYEFAAAVEFKTPQHATLFVLYIGHERMKCSNP